MAGDYTQVPLRRDERWTAARMQQGRVLLDHDWNLNVDASARAVRQAARDAIGWAGVVEGSDDFLVTVAGSGELTIAPGVMWVDGLAAFAPAAFTYGSQEGIPARPGSGNGLVYLDVWDEEVQPAEDPGDLVDPALSPVDTTTRGRVGYRVRVFPTDAQTCKDAWAALTPTLVEESTGTLTISRGTGPVSTDPCAPPGDPLAQLPDGLLRVEVLDHGTQATARFAWSFEDGATAVQVVGVAGSNVTLAPSNLHLGVGDLVEVSWLMRRADRLNHGALYTVQDVTPGAGGDTVKLDRAVTLPASATGVCVRRWDGQAVGAAAVTTARWHGLDLGIQFTAGAGDFQAGDWWGARFRSEAGGVEQRTNAAPDGTGHVFAPLALVDFTNHDLLHDCRPTFVSLVDLEFGGACTISVKPGDDLQAAVDALPDDGGELCMAAGLYELSTPVLVDKRRRIVINGAGPATVIRSLGHEAAIVFTSCSEIDVRDVRVEGGPPGGGGGDPDLEGALTFLNCADVSVHDCALFCPDQQVRMQTCVTVRSEPGAPLSDGVRIERNRLEVGAWQTGVLVVDAGACVVADNRVQLADGPSGFHGFTDHPTLGQNLTAFVREGIRTKSGAGVSRVAVPGADKPLLVRKGSKAEVIVRDFARLTSAGKVRKAGGAEKALLAFTKKVGQGANLGDVSPEHAALIGTVLAANRTVGQGIVVAGGRLGSARIDRNLVESVVQGIHVGVSDARKPGREVADTVIVSGNIVHSLVPGLFNRDRHAVFVGNARTVHITDTVATLQRLVPPGGLGDFAGSNVEAIRVHGALGPFMTVRQSSISGFTFGVTVTPLAPVPRSRMWLVAETFATGAAAVVQAPATVLQERNFQ